jgi:hypothetical protein
MAAMAHVQSENIGAGHIQALNQAFGGA